MAERIVRTDEEVNRVLNWAAEGEDNGTHFKGMSYEQGIKAMYDWLIGMIDEAPDQDE